MSCLKHGHYETEFRLLQKLRFACSHVTKLQCDLEQADNLLFKQN